MAINKHSKPYAKLFLTTNLSLHLSVKTDSISFACELALFKGLFCMQLLPEATMCAAEGQLNNSHLAWPTTQTSPTAPPRESRQRERMRPQQKTHTSVLKTCKNTNRWCSVTFVAPWRKKKIKMDNLLADKAFGSRMLLISNSVPLN